MAVGGVWDSEVVERTGVPEPDEATLNPYGLIGYEHVAVTTVPATGPAGGLPQSRHAPGG
jgi:hypothetical protein